jgi:hypothetical protein
MVIRIDEKNNKTVNLKPVFFLREKPTFGLQIPGRCIGSEAEAEDPGVRSEQRPVHG